jgi:hypothetical protein
MKTVVNAAVVATAIALTSGCGGGGGMGNIRGSQDLGQAVGQAITSAIIASRDEANASPQGCTNGGFSLLFYGCMSGPDGSVASSSAVPPTQFTSWTALPPFTNAQGAGIEAGMGYQAAPGGAILSTDTTGGIYERTLMNLPSYNTGGKLDYLEMGGGYVGDPKPNLAAIGQPGIDTDNGAIASVSPIAVPMVANPYALGWDYQSFGVWTSGNVFRANSYGSPTPGSAIPAIGAATFTGKLAGAYVSPAGAGSAATAELTVSANFGARSLDLRSTGTTLTRDFATATPAPNLDVTGTLTYAAGSNSFRGTIVNTGGTMSGSSLGQFYGPAAQELGGAFTLKAPAGVESFVGAYGAKR